MLTTSLMATTFPLMKPRQSLPRLSSAAASVVMPSVVSWRRRRHAASSLCLRRQAQQHSAQVGYDDHLDIVEGERLSLSPAAGGFQPSIWGDFFLHHSDPAAGSSDEQQAWMLKRAEVLKEEVRSIVASSDALGLHQRLRLIDALERLCLDYLLEEEINVALAEVSAANVSDCDLQTVALWFYLLRKHGYKVSPDVFLRFRDEEGRFFAHTPVDLLNLYNAASLRTHGETVLDEATLFARKCLAATLPDMKGSVLAPEIKRAIEIPLPRRVSIYESKDQISRYENEAIVDEAVIQLAKLNSNIMQLHYQRELKIITRWWKDLDIESKLPFARDRLVECYWWMLGVYFEPCYSRGRIILSMVISIATIFDDIYDSYGTAEDCELFTKCIESWDLTAANDLPECMKYALGKIFESYQTIENELLAHEERYRMVYLRNFTLDLVKGYNAEVKMREDGYVPKSVEEHLQISARTGACHLLSCASLVGMGDIATKDSFEWVSTMPKMVQGLCVILRLLDDLQTYEREKMTPHVASTIDSYMKEHNVSIEIAREKIQELKEETWKDFNAEWLNPENSQPKQILNRIFNLTRSMEFFYNKDDNFTNCHNIKDTIRALLVEPFTIA